MGGGRQTDWCLASLSQPSPITPSRRAPASTACLRRSPDPQDMACAHQDEDVGAEGTGVGQRRQLAQAHLVCPQDEIS